MPRVSVIIPTYNQARYLPAAVQSVLGQTFGDLELIVVNDGSTDNTRQALASFNDHRIRYFYQENRGLSAARNTGILASAGEYIALLDSDDIWLPRKLELQVGLLDSHPETALVYSDAYLFDDKTSVITGKFLDGKGIFSGKVFRQLLSTQFIKPSTAVIRRSVFYTTGYFDEAIREVQDRDMWLRIARQFNVEGIDIPLAKIRNHTTNVSKNSKKVWQGRALVMNKAARILTLNPDDLKLLERNLSTVYYEHGRYLVLRGRLGEGREKLVACTRLNPWYIRAYPYLVASLFNSSFLAKVGLWGRRLKSHFT